MSNPTQQQADAQLKYNISVKILERICESLSCTLEEYGQIYDSEKHEQMLIAIMSLIQADRQRVLYNLHHSIMDGELKLGQETDPAFNYARVHRWIDHNIAALTPNDKEKE